MKTRALSRSRKRGMTIIEVAIGALLFGMVMAGAALVSVQGGGAYDSISRGNELSARSVRA